MVYAIITGASRGLGAAAAKQLLAEANVISVSRAENEDLRNLAENSDREYIHYTCDLADSSEVQSVFKKIADSVFKQEPDAIYLINNAGMVDPIETAGNLDEEKTAASVNVNLLAPMIISNIFLEKAEASDARLVIANVSSGAGSRPIQGWGVYCSTKAGINMFTQTAALELENRSSRHKIFAFSPGVMDTDMQSTIRSASKSAFNDIETFKKYKEEGMLRDADTVAGALIKVLRSETIENGKIYQINALL
ncbi:(S)-benzoin forming benzil reductase [Bacillus salacetis]|uniref:(S)-benzoin forming benzil reductase n=1 Tax=Bacillus salacetis TaxID=2315464 RepID=A0A3A1R027_9BACI|nr:(S)-benzoin forming benzil reductase [Bacillus salacetis]RIW32762.1 (S)-benzoin forming benzil reductase [Bacillus salacetis]